MTKEWEKRGNLILVNGRVPLEEDAGQRMIPALEEYPDILLAWEAALHLRRALLAVCGDGEIVPVSGYRSLREQQEIWDDSLAKNGEEFTRSFVALPGHSEHQTGLAIDLALKKDEIDFIRPDFPYEGICGEFRKIASEYGFVERYPAGKEKITGIAHEPWHFRYVGYPHSRIMEMEGLTLEEYLELLRGYPDLCRPFRFQDRGKTYGIILVPGNTQENEKLMLPTGSVCKMSGGDGQGVIVTFWEEEQ